MHLKHGTRKSRGESGKCRQLNGFDVPVSIIIPFTVIVGSFSSIKEGGTPDGGSAPPLWESCPSDATNGHSSLDNVDVGLPFSVPLSSAGESDAISPLELFFTPLPSKDSLQPIQDKMKLNQSTNQSTKQWINQSAEQSVNQSINGRKTTNQSIEQTINQSNEETNVLIRYSDNELQKKSYGSSNDSNVHKSERFRSVYRSISGADIDGLSTNCWELCGSERFALVNSCSDEAFLLPCSRLGFDEGWSIWHHFLNRI